ncbi:MAG: hypothetical protein ACOX6D_00625 [Thermoguttaceae bacterium]
MSPGNQECTISVKCTTSVFGTFWFLAEISAGFSEKIRKTLSYRKNRSVALFRQLC